MEIFRHGGVRIAVLDERPLSPGEDRPVLLVHGFASSARINWVETGWVKLLAEAGHRTVAYDQRGHGASDKPHEAESYAPDVLAADARALLGHLAIPRADVIGYSMGARVAAFLALAAPECVRSLVLGGLGGNLVDGRGLPPGIAAAMEAPSIDDIADPTERSFRRFAEAAGNDLSALAACIRGSRRDLSPADLARIRCPVLVAVGTKDTVAGDPRRLAALIPGAEVLDITDRDHNPAVGDKRFKAGVLQFLASHA